MFCFFKADVLLKFFFYLLQLSKSVGFWRLGPVELFLHTLIALQKSSTGIFLQNNCLVYKVKNIWA